FAALSVLSPPRTPCIPLPAYSVRFPRHALGVFPSPLWGGVRGGGRCFGAMSVHHRTTPSPPLPHKGGGSRPRSRGGAENHLCRSFPRKRESSSFIRIPSLGPRFRRDERSELFRGDERKKV